MKMLKAFAAAAALVMLTGCGAAPAADISDDISAGMTETDAFTETDDNAEPSDGIVDDEKTLSVTDSAAETADDESGDGEKSALTAADAADDGGAVSQTTAEDRPAVNEAADAYPDSGIADDSESGHAVGLINLPVPSAEAKGDIITISVNENYLDCTVRYGRLVLLEESSTSELLYFQAVSEGKDNIVISENSSEGVIFREYIASIAEDLTVTLLKADDVYDRGGCFDDGIMPLI